MPDRVWKAVERRIATFFGTTRTALSGGNSKVTRSDTLHPRLFIETKYRRAFAVLNLWKEVRILAKKEKKIPVVCLVEKGKEGFWILCHSDHLWAIGKESYLAWFERPAQPPDSHFVMEYPEKWPDLTHDDILTKKK